MLAALITFFGKRREIPLNPHEFQTVRYPTDCFMYHIEGDWIDEDSKVFFTAVDITGFPIVFPDTDINISGETEDIVRKRMFESYPLAEEE